MPTAQTPTMPVSELVSWLADKVESAAQSSEHPKIMEVKT